MSCRPGAQSSLWPLAEKLALGLSGGGQKLHLAPLKAEWQRREQHRLGDVCVGGLPTEGSSGLGDSPGAGTF